MSDIRGFTFVDGSIRKQQGKSSTLRLYNSDLEILTDIRKTLNSSHRITLDIRTGTDYTLEISRLEVVEGLETL